MFFRMIYKLDRSFYRFVTIHACDRRTDKRTDGRTDRILLAIPRLHYMQRGKKHKIHKHKFILLVRAAHTLRECLRLFTIVIDNTAQNSSDNLPPLSSQIIIPAQMLSIGRQSCRPRLYLSCRPTHIG